MDRADRPQSHEARPDSEEDIREDSELTPAEREERGQRAGRKEGEEPNPPRTTTGKMTAPKFGSAGSGGLEIEPGLDRD